MLRLLLVMYGGHATHTKMFSLVHGVWKSVVFAVYDDFLVLIGII